MKIAKKWISENKDSTFPMRSIWEIKISLKRFDEIQWDNCEIDIIMWLSVCYENIAEPALKLIHH